jgi:hypothetical protein
MFKNRSIRRGTVVGAVTAVLAATLLLFGAAPQASAQRATSPDCGWTSAGTCWSD